MFRVQEENPIHVLNADMFVTPLTMFELFFYVAYLAYLLAEALLPPPSRTHPFNKLDIEAKQGKDSDRHGSPSCCLCLVRLEIPSHMYCFCLSFYKFIC